MLATPSTITTLQFKKFLAMHYVGFFSTQEKKSIMVHKMRLTTTPRRAPRGTTSRMHLQPIHATRRQW